MVCSFGEFRFGENSFVIRQVAIEQPVAVQKRVPKPTYQFREKIQEHALGIRFPWETRTQADTIPTIAASGLDENIQIKGVGGLFHATLSPPFIHPLSNYMSSSLNLISRFWEQ
eukprot:6471467-Amphidinium_carterae.1